MKKHIKAEYIAALRSKKYPQGTDTLKNIHGEFCFLGVLCQMYAEQFGISWEEDEDKVFDPEFLGETELLPQAVAEWAGIERDPKIEGRRIVDINDEDKLTFAGFADLVEEKL